MSYFSKNIRFLRELKGITQDAFEQIGIKKGTYSNYENGKTEPNIETLMKISKFLGFDLDSLICINLSILSDDELLKICNSAENNGKVNGKANGKVLDENMYLSSQPDNIQPSHHIVAEPSTDDIYRKESPTQQFNGANDIIMNLVEQIKEQSEEIGALRHAQSARA